MRDQSTSQSEALIGRRPAKAAVVTELSDEQLDWVAGGRKAGGGQMKNMR